MSRSAAAAAVVEEGAMMKGMMEFTGSVAEYEAEMAIARDALAAAMAESTDDEDEEAPTTTTTTTTTQTKQEEQQGQGRQATAEEGQRTAGPDPQELAAATAASISDGLRADAHTHNTTGHIPAAPTPPQDSWASGTTITAEERAPPQSLQCVCGAVAALRLWRPWLAEPLSSPFCRAFGAVVSAGVAQMVSRFAQMAAAAGGGDDGVAAMCAALGGALVLRNELIAARHQLCQNPEIAVGPLVAEIERLSEAAQTSGDRIVDAVVREVSGVVVPSIVQFAWAEERQPPTSPQTSASTQALLVILQAAFSQLRRFAPMAAVEALAGRVVGRLAEIFVAVFAELQPSAERAPQLQRDANAIAAVLKSCSLVVGSERVRSLINGHLATIVSIGAIHSSPAELVASPVVSSSKSISSTAITSKLSLVPPSVIFEWPSPGPLHLLCVLSSSLEAIGAAFDATSIREAVEFIAINNPMLFSKILARRSTTTAAVSK
jgi:hypothetical protein